VATLAAGHLTRGPPLAHHGGASPLVAARNPRDFIASRPPPTGNPEVPRASGEALKHTPCATKHCSLHRCTFTTQHGPDSATAMTAVIKPSLDPDVLSQSGLSSGGEVANADCASETELRHIYGSASVCPVVISLGVSCLITDNRGTSTRMAGPQSGGERGGGTLRLMQPSSHSPMAGQVVLLYLCQIRSTAATHAAQAHLSSRSRAATPMPWL
jgi:hypothetical protein